MKPSAGTRRFRRSGKRRGCSVERRRATDNVARLVCEARAVASFEPPLSYFRAARATRQPTSPRQPTCRASMHRSLHPPPPPPRSRSPRALHRNTGSIFFPRSCTEHDQPHRCAQPTLVDSSHEGERGSISLQPQHVHVVGRDSSCTRRNYSTRCSTCPYVVRFEEFELTCVVREVRL